MDNLTEPINVESILEAVPSLIDVMSVAVLATVQITVCGGSRNGASGVN
jgi:hypothetical protein